MISSRQYGKALALLERYWRTYGALPGIRQFWPYFSHEGERMAKTTKQKPILTPKVLTEMNALAKKLDALHASADAAGAKVDPCATWATVKPYWARITLIVTLIPRVGSKISLALVKIGEGLDQLCPPVVP